MPTRTVTFDGPYDLLRTLAPLARGKYDPTLRLTSGSAWLALRTAAGPVTLHVIHDGDRLIGEAWGEGAEVALERLPQIAGVGLDAPWSGDLRQAPDAVVAGLARQLPGIRIPATGAVLDALFPAILEQKVTGSEARRAWLGLLRKHGAPAPSPSPAPSSSPTPSPSPSPSPSLAGEPVVGHPDAPTLRLRPEASLLARLPTYAYHPFGVEERRATTIKRAAARADWLEAIVDEPTDVATGRLRGLPGIGPWTAAEVAVRALGDPDAVSVGDFHLPNLVTWAIAREPRANDARMLELLAPYDGRRALVIRLLEASGLRPPRYGPRLSPRRIEDL